MTKEEGVLPQAEQIRTQQKHPGTFVQLKLFTWVRRAFQTVWWFSADDSAEWSPNTVKTIYFERSHVSGLFWSWYSCNQHLLLLQQHYSERDSVIFGKKKIEKDDLFDNFEAYNNKPRVEKVIVFGHLWFLCHPVWQNITNPISVRDTMREYVPYIRQ